MRNLTLWHGLQRLLQVPIEAPPGSPASQSRSVSVTSSVSSASPLMLLYPLLDREGPLQITNQVKASVLVTSLNNHRPFFGKSVDTPIASHPTAQDRFRWGALNEGLCQGGFDRLSAGFPHLWRRSSVG